MTFIGDGNNMFTFNFNEQIGVRLTESGLRNYTEYCAMAGYVHIVSPKVDENGYTWFQAWQFFQIFGEHFGMGKEIPCEGNIKVKKGMLEIS